MDSINGPQGLQGLLPDNGGMANYSDTPMHCVPTLSGSLVNILDPKADSIRMTDIAVGLGNTCRYAGQIEQFYSVAQHSVIVSRMVEGRLAPYGLLHDASEAFLHDLAPAVKELVGPLYRPVEDRLQEVIYAAFGLAPLSEVDKAAINRADKQVAIAEMHRFGLAGEALDGPLMAIADPVIAMDPSSAKACFKQRFSELLG